MSGGELPAWVDTHCHLDAAELASDRQALVAAARAAGVAALVVPAVERANFAAVTAVCREFAGCAPAYGIHPLYVEHAGDDDIDALRAVLAQQRGVAVALGEIGLDFYLPGHDAARQEALFVAQLKLARELGLPVLLHVRAAVDAVLKQLRRIRVVGGIAHAFNGSAEQAAQFIDLGFKLGIGGAATHARALHLRKLAANLPLAALVLETDAPDIPPAWLHKQRNTPAQLPRIAEEIARLRGIDLEELARATSANACAVLPGLAL